MNAPLEIRPAGPDDVEAVVSANLRLADESESITLPRDVLAAGVRAALADPVKARYFLACCDGRSVGQLMLTTEWSDWRNGHIWWIQSVYVEPDYRRRGVYRTLHDHVEQLAQAREDVIGLRLYVERNNTVAQAVYRSAGMDDAGYLVYEQMLVKEGGGRD